MLASDAVIVWEWMISLYTEWYIIWKSPWTLVKGAYLFCRYWVLITIPQTIWAIAIGHSQETCQRIYKVAPALAITVILLLRTWAFFRRDMRVLIGLSLTLAGVLAYQLWVVAAVFQQIRAYSCPAFNRRVVLPFGPQTVRHRVAPLCFDTLVTVMIVIKSIVRRRHRGPSSRIIQVFIREGVFYYITISVANLVNGLAYVQPRKDLSGTMVPLVVMLGPVLACRLVRFPVSHLSLADTPTTDHRHPQAPPPRHCIRASRSDGALTRSHVLYLPVRREGQR
ncbi:hypothetical protein K488DRAFT_41313 [Vararia minispora EC-137]|uniref:Uncharacterized protein n=1 Tax=Vararia minispora EC-137 TaxID=1314806 RepID=A0ACB8QXI1_9AGAM|nr:hypothetical protein K488DRAFT_41313 [Vararia minispora EC-137]